METQKHDTMAHFRITYDGPALVAHEMDVRELAPALLAAGDLLEAATAALYGERLKPQINVRGSFKTGSFGIDFTLAADWLTKVKDLFASDSASAAANALEILGALGFVAWNGKKGVMHVIARLRGRKIQKVEILDASAVLHIGDESIEIEQEVLALLRDLDVREAIDKLLEPLDREGIDVFAAGTDDSFSARIDRSERQWFCPPAWDDELLLDEVRKMVFSIVSLAFKEENKWRLYDGAATIHATIADEEFLSRVNHNIERFAKGDILICSVRVRQWQTPTGAKTEYEVTEVLEHRQAARQLRLHFE